MRLTLLCLSRRQSWRQDEMSNCQIVPSRAGQWPCIGHETKLATITVSLSYSSEFDARAQLEVEGNEGREWRQVVQIYFALFSGRFCEGSLKGKQNIWQFASIHYLPFPYGVCSFDMSARTDITNWALVL